MRRAGIAENNGAVAECGVGGRGRESHGRINVRGALG